MSKQKNEQDTPPHSVGLCSTQKLTCPAHCLKLLSKQALQEKTTNKSIIHFDTK
jgi:hypothetical protein